MHGLKDRDLTGNALMSLRLEPMPTMLVEKNLFQLWRDHSAMNLTCIIFTISIHVCHRSYASRTAYGSHIGQVVHCRTKRK
jgi:hypothetical protein